MKQKLLLAFILVCISDFTDAQIINIPADQPTIQAGIDVAEDGDTVLVSEGTYFENINFLGKPITVASEFLMDGDTSHISRTIIDGSQSVNPDTVSTVIMVSGEDTTSVLMGFTIQGGRGTDCVPLNDGITRKGGGGVYMFKSGGLIYRNIIQYNHLEDPSITAFFGGGICVWLELSHTVIIRENWIHHNTITANVGAANGGGVGLIGGRVICEGNEISDNDVSAPDWADGGGIFWERAANQETIEEGIIRNNVIINNIVSGKSGGGGGYYQGGGSDGSHALVYNNIFSHNIAKGNYGSAMGVNYSVGAIFNNTIVDNLQDANKYSVVLYPGKAGLAFVNNIVSTSTDVSYPDIGFYGDGTAYLYHNLHNKPLPSSLTNVVAEGNVYREPEFKPGSFQLAQNSPAVGRGIDSLFILDTYYLAPGTDLNGNPRPNPVDGRVDIGAIESPYVEYVYIPDTAFLYALIEEGVDTNGDSLISFEEAERITSLTISNALYMGGGGGPPWICIERSSLASLQGIEAFTNLDTLSCVCHSIETIDLSNNQKLKLLALDFNQLTSLDVSNNIALKELWCIGNQLTNLNVSNNTGLEALDCSMNLLTSLNVTNNKALKHLACHENQISELNLCNNSMLRNLGCSGNHLHFLDLSNNTQLEEFYLEDMPTLELVCVWESTVRASFGSPNIVYTTECNYCLIPNIVSIDTLYQPEFIEVTSSEDGMIYLVPVDTDQDIEVIRGVCMDSVEAVMNTPVKISLEGIENNTYWLYATDRSGNISEPKAFIVLGIGIVQRNSENLLIYPNPTHTLLTIETATSDLNNIEITSLNGQHLFSREMKGTIHQLDLSSFQKGIYFITIRSKDCVTTRKIIKL